MDKEVVLTEFAKVINSGNFPYCMKTRSVCSGSPSSSAASFVDSLFFFFFIESPFPF